MCVQPRRLITGFVLGGMLLATLAATGPAQPQEIYIPDNIPTPGICNHFPFNPTWSGSNGEWRYQALFTATQMGGQGCLISDISFAPCSTGTFSATNFELRICHTTATSLSTAMDSNITSPVSVIPAGPFTWNPVNATWTSLTIATPFSYNGTDNLVVEVRYTGGSLGGSFGGTIVRAGVAQRVYAFGTGAFTSNAGTNGGATAFKIKFSCGSAVLMGLGTTRPGGQVDLVLKAPGDGGLPYQVGTSLGAGPIPLDTRLLNLSLDKLLEVTVMGYLPGVFQNYAGILSASGTGAAKIVIPNNSGLVGVRLHSAFLTIKPGEPSNIKSISNTLSFSITS